MHKFVVLTLIGVAALFTTAPAQAGITWTFIQSGYSFTSSGCASGTTSCQISLTSAVAAGHILVIQGQLFSATVSPLLSSITEESSAQDCAPCQNTNPGSGNVNQDIMYVSAATGGESTITCNYTAATTLNFCAVAEFSCGGCTGVSLDTGGIVPGFQCSNCSGPSLSLAGPSELVVQTLLGGTYNAISVSSPYTPFCIGASGAGSCAGMGGAYLLNASSATAPIWTMDGMGGAYANAIALKGTGGGGISVSVSPTTSSLSASQTQQFTATVTGTTNQAVTWSLSPITGTITSGGLYTAPSTIITQQNVTVTATSVADMTTSANATVTLNPPTSGSWTFIQNGYWQCNTGSLSSCLGTGGSQCLAGFGTAQGTCVVSGGFNPITPGNFLLIVSITQSYNNGANINIASVPEEPSLQHCTPCFVGYLYNPNAITDGYSPLQMDVTYVLSANGGESTITCNETNPGSAWGWNGCEFYEFHWSGSGGVSFDNGVNNGAGPNCGGWPTTGGNFQYTATPITLQGAGNSNLVYRADWPLSTNVSNISPSPPWTGPNNPPSYLDDSFALNVPSSTGTPTWTVIKPDPWCLDIAANFIGH